MICDCTKTSTLLGVLACLAGLTALAAPAASSVTLAWNTQPGSGVAGYRLYQGVVSQLYTNVLDVGSATNVTVSGLIPGVTYYFALAAYDINGLQSPLSGELAYSVPALPVASASLQLTLLSPGKVQLTGSAPAGYVYDVQVSRNLSTWSRLGSTTASAAGSLAFTDSGATNSCGYYRLRQTSP